jgi:hypothetical protein
MYVHRLVKNHLPNVAIVPRSVGKDFRGEKEIIVKSSDSNKNTFGIQYV